MLSSARTVSGDDEEVRSYLTNYTELKILDDDAVGDEELAKASPSVRHLCGALLVDVALLGDGDGEGLERLTELSHEAQRQGVGAEFDKVFAKATERTLAEVRKLRSSR